MENIDFNGKLISKSYNLGIQFMTNLRKNYQPRISHGYADAV